MEKKMTVMGVGKKIAVPIVIYIAITLLVNHLAFPLFRITEKGYGTLAAVGVALAVAGFSINMIAAISMLKGYKSGKLVTGGLYKVLRDPMYVIQIFVTLPGLMLLLNSWLCLTTVVIAYITYKVMIKAEYDYLEGKFGKEYREYRKKVLVKFL